MTNRLIHYVLVLLFALTALLEDVVSGVEFIWIGIILLGSLFLKILIQRKRIVKHYVWQMLLDYISVFVVAFLMQTDQAVYYIIFLIPALRIPLQSGKQGSLIASGITAACLFLLWLVKAEQSPTMLFLLWNIITVACWYIGTTTDSKLSYLQMAYLDPLTGAYNRRFLQDRLNDILHSSVIRNEPITLMMLDLDHFKKINDSYGHDVGDQILKEFTEVLRQQLRQTDITIRFGGEEFAVLLPKLGIEQAQMIGERIRQKVEEHAFLIQDQDETVHVTVSIGIAAYSQHQNKYDLLRAADQALYTAKANRNQVSAV